MFSNKTLKPGQKLTIGDGVYDYESIKNAIQDSQRLKKIQNAHIEIGGPEKRSFKPKFAFSCGGKDFYTCEPEQLTERRYKEFLVRYEEMKMGIGYDTLKEFQIRKRKLSKGDSFNFSEYMRIDWEIDLRMANAPFENHIWDLCSVMFFEADEDLTTYDFAKSNEKIALWKKHNEPHDFFLNKPVMELVGLKDQSPEDLKTFLTNGRILLEMLKKSYTKQ